MHGSLKSPVTSEDCVILVDYDCADEADCIEVFCDLPNLLLRMSMGVSRIEPKRCGCAKHNPFRVHGHRLKWPCSNEQLGFPKQSV